jgi:hypothetical protein
MHMAAQIKLTKPFAIRTKLPDSAKSESLTLDTAGAIVVSNYNLEVSCTPNSCMYG